MTLGRPDGYGFKVSTQDVYTIAAHNQSDLEVLPDASLSTVTCKSPSTDAAKFTQFSVLNSRTLTPVDWEISEVGVECDGIDDYMTLNAVGNSLGTESYAFGMWVFPYKEPRPHGNLEVVASDIVFTDDPVYFNPNAGKRRSLLESNPSAAISGRPSDKRHSMVRR